MVEHAEFGKIRRQAKFPFHCARTRPSSTRCFPIDQRHFVPDLLVPGQIMTKNTVGLHERGEIGSKRFPVKQKLSLKLRHGIFGGSGLQPQLIHSPSSLMRSPTPIDRAVIAQRVEGLSYHVDRDGLFPRAFLRASAQGDAVSSRLKPGRNTLAAP